MDHVLPLLPRLLLEIRIRLIVTFSDCVTLRLSYQYCHSQGFTGDGLLALIGGKRANQPFDSSHSAVDVLRLDYIRSFFPKLLTIESWCHGTLKIANVYTQRKGYDDPSDQQTPSSPSSAPAHPAPSPPVPYGFSDSTSHCTTATTQSPDTAPLALR